MSTIVLSFYAKQEYATIEPGRSRLFECPVPDDKLIVGGGAYVQDAGANYVLKSSFLIDDGVTQRWGAVWTNPTNVNDPQVVGFTVSAHCIDKQIVIEKRLSDQENADRQ